LNKPFKNIDDILHNDAGCGSELDYVEQTSWVLFLKYLDDLEKDKKAKADLSGKEYTPIISKEYKWEKWAAPKTKDGKLDHHKALSGDDLKDFVDLKLFPYLKKFKTSADSPDTIEYKIGEIFSELKNKIQSGYNLREVINYIDELRFRSHKEKHEMSHLYESKINNMGNAGRNGGEYYTPRPLIKTIVKVVAPKIGDKIYDGAIGSAGFLCEAFQYLKENKKLSTSDMTTLQKKTFYGKERKEVQQNFPIKTGETAFLFLQHFIKILKAGGKAGMVIKNTFLSNTDNASVSLRQTLLESCNLHTVLDLPGGVFTGAGVKTVVLFFEKGAPTKKVWYYQLNLDRNLGKTNPLNENDLAEFIKLQKKKRDSENSWSVDIKDIDETTFDLSVKNPNKKDETVLQEPKEILAEISKLDKESAEILKKVKELFESYLNGIFTNLGEDWEEKKLGEVCEVIAGQSPESKFYNDKGEGLPFYQGKKEFTDKFVGKPVKWTTKITKEAKENDILMSVRALVGPVNFSTQKICIGRGLSAIRCGKLADKEFVFNFLKKHEDEITENAGAVFNSINKKQIEQIQIPIPPLPEQKRIVAKLDQLQTETNRLEKTYQQKITDLEELKK